jgi:Na+-driven multidrug efflux pump
VPGPILSVFHASAQMLAIGEVALRVISWSFLLAGYSVVLCSVFQALGKGMLSLYVSVGRQIVVLIPAAWLLAQLGRLELVWWAFPIAEVVSLGLCLAFLWYVDKTILRTMDAPQNDTLLDD